MTVAYQYTHQVPFLRKAQALVCALASRRLLPITGAERLAADSGPLVAAVLRAKGVVTYSEQLAAAVDGGHQLEAGPGEVAVRAAAVTAVDAVCGAAGGAFSPQELSNYLMLQAAEGQPYEAQAKSKHLTRGTTAY